MNHSAPKHSRTVSSSLKASIRRLLVLCLLPLTLAGCDLFGEDDDESVVTTGTVVANSGNFSDQDGSITVFNPEDSTTTLNEAPGIAFINSIALRGDRLFVVDNTQADNAGRITVLDLPGLNRVDQIENTDGSPPRSIAFASDEKAYVTNQNLNSSFRPVPSTVSVLDLTSNSVSDSVAVGSGPEGIAITSGRAFAANSADGTLTVIDTETDAVDATVDLGCTGPNEVFVDGEDEVVVVCEGGGATTGEVVFVDPSNLQVLDRIALDAVVGSANFTQSAAYSEIAEELYAISGGVFGSGTGEIFRINTDGNVLDATLQVPEDPALTGMTAVGYDAIGEALYVARLPVGDDGSASFTARSTAVILDRDGNQVGSFRTGIAPAHIAFLRDTR